MRNLIVLALLLIPAMAFANGYENYPMPLAWSPDGSMLVSAEAISWPYNEGLVTGTLRLYDAEGAPLAELLSGLSVGSPAFSSDNYTLICVHEGKIAKFAAPFESGNVQFISASSPVLDCTFEDWDSQGSIAILASCGERFYGANIWRIGLDGSDLEQLTFAGPDRSAVAPLSLAYDSFLYLLQPGDDRGGAYERLWHWNKGPKETETIQRTGPQIPAEWPDDYHESNPVIVDREAQEIIFQRGGWGDWALFRQGIDGEEFIELDDAEEPSLSADARWLAFVRRPAYAKAQTEYDWDVIPQIWLADRSCHQLWHVESSIAGGEFPALSPDGSKLAWIEYNNGKVQTVVKSVAEITAAEASGSY